MKLFGVDESPWLILAMPAFEQCSRELEADGVGVRYPVNWARFPDGTPNITFDAIGLQGRDVLLLGSPEPNQYLEFFSTVYSVPRYMAKSFLVVLPYFHTGTMERVEREGEVATAKTLARMLSCTPAPQIGQTTFMIFDMHALATRFFFSDHVKITLPSAIPELVERFRRTAAAAHSGTVRGADYTVCFPDDGAKKRFSLLFKNLGVALATCGKTRVGNERHITLQEGSVRGRHVVIVDDLVQSGSTIASCRDVLIKEGATSVSAYVTHAVFPREAWKRFLVDASGKEEATGLQGFHEFIVTDSNPWTTQQLAGKRPFVVLPLAKSISRVLKRRVGSAAAVLGTQGTAAAHL